jgi:bis(5'-nucleosyl)-tetraphosphatase (symmetrical)
MAVYAIGDVQGCLAPLEALLAGIGFDSHRDELWFTGDLVNRGPRSLEVLRYVRALGARAVTVLGNHDLHLLARAAGRSRAKARDTLDALLAAPDRDELLAWLRTRPLLHHDAALGYTLVHAGLLPQWDLAGAQRLAREAEAVIAGTHSGLFYDHMYGDLPDHWRDDLAHPERLRVIINAFTRLRYCDLEGNMDLREKGAPGSQPPDLVPWYEVPHRGSRNLRVVFGHWSTLGLRLRNDLVALDTGCVWGGELTAVRLGPEGATLAAAVPCRRPSR